MHVAERAPAAAESDQDGRSLQDSRIEIEALVVHRLNREARRRIAWAERLNLSGRPRHGHVGMTKLNRGTVDEAQDQGRCEGNENK